MEYRIQQCNNESSRYGKCEVCNKNVSETYKQQKRKSSEAKGWITGLFGHYQCLLFGNFKSYEMPEASK